ncbi:uncharacterized protein CTRU02_205208 [Colletotrichum truncatum]|uniref:Uncharacterized protein n=1 Tax=Colletotrichum truncatum TaxID=5467 RepID=A0ACC3Z3D1_COLTU|nr:uncharacterized protein CTRU02_05968 [Colletotrichum truncatum]KAF6793096.1 hypothetical protein CTRU02_05968 [Colletotrichum truncatum]
MSSTNPSDIPPISALREALDYGDVSLPRCKAFYDSCRYFQSSFISRQGWEASSLFDWKSREHQAALSEMTRAYLDTGGNGRVFWPDNETTSRSNKLKYSVNQALIRRVMRQLFWRLNLQQHRNAKYRKNKKTTNEPSRNGRGLSHDNPIDLDLVVDESSNRRAADTPNTPRSETVPGFANRLENDNANTLGPASSMRQGSKDLYRVPDSPDLGTHVPTNQPIFGLMSSGPRNNDTRRFVPYTDAEMEPPANRTVAEDTAPADTMSSVKRGKRRAVYQMSRSSPRKRRTRRDPGFATQEEVDNALQSPERAPSPANDENHAAVELNTAAGEGSSRNTNYAQRDAGEGPSTNTDYARHELRATIEDEAEEDDTNAFVDDSIIQLENEILQSANTATSNNSNIAPFAQMNPTESTPQGAETSAAGEQMGLGSVPSGSSAVGIEDQQAQNNQPIVDNNPPQVTPSKKKPQLEFNYSVITNYPTRKSTPWIPKGSFKSKTLSELWSELPVDLSSSHVKCLRFLMVAPGTCAEHLVYPEQEDQFNVTKRRLAKFMIACLAEAKDGKTVNVDIEIEVVTDADATGGGIDEEDLVW